MSTSASPNTSKAWRVDINSSQGSGREGTIACRDGSRQLTSWRAWTALAALLMGLETFAVLEYGYAKDKWVGYKQPESVAFCAASMFRR